MNAIPAPNDENNQNFPEGHPASWDDEPTVEYVFYASDGEDLDDFPDYDDEWDDEDDYDADFESTEYQEGFQVGYRLGLNHNTLKHRAKRAWQALRWKWQDLRYKLKLIKKHGWKWRDFDDSDIPF